MDCLPFAFVDDVIHHVSRKSVSSLQNLNSGLWSTLARDHAKKRRDFTLEVLLFYGGEFLCTLQPVDGGRRYVQLPPNVELAYVRIQTIILENNASPVFQHTKITFEALIKSLAPLKPLLNTVTSIDIRMAKYKDKSLNEEHMKHFKNLQFLWKIPIRQLVRRCGPEEVLSWHAESNPNLEEVHGTLNPVFAEKSIKGGLMITSYYIYIDPDLIEFVGAWRQNRKAASIVLIGIIKRFRGDCALLEFFRDQKHDFGSEWTETKEVGDVFAVGNVHRSFEMKHPCADASLRLYALHL
ncbi:hypothetical protein QR680_008129 [Steinernema hermaphroditum]|uniref:Uncharacterized protein n=1 Tax=Steinernema hermaphroditum TaxID=289476 RepID=A0AA39M7J6_9BILA|nr:hypothetical protein QR680_008129 [Steinernema hermaphroditum]